ncbi:MAG: hypothetical protein JRC56_01790 [Deltaproteobacteria bacterium]|nr:hypothetical protein [Deltaproteobacteria bacterium]MBW2620050.1 hypothetical protein [Deltaproteobacteria bacterium]
MKRRMLVLFALVSVLSLSTVSASAADQERAQERVQKQEQEQIYGSQLMTQQERAEYHTKIRAAKTAEEREQIRNEHHARMKARTVERGLTLPEEPARGRGMDPGCEGIGPGGGGMGHQGGGMGSRGGGTGSGGHRGH